MKSKLIHTHTHIEGVVVHVFTYPLKPFRLLTGDVCWFGSMQSLSCGTSGMRGNGKKNNVSENERSETVLCQLQFMCVCMVMGGDWEG